MSPLSQNSQVNENVVASPKQTKIKKMFGVEIEVEDSVHIGVVIGFGCLRMYTWN